MSNRKRLQAKLSSMGTAPIVPGPNVGGKAVKHKNVYDPMPSAPSPTGGPTLSSMINPRAKSIGDQKHRSKKPMMNTGAVAGKVLTGTDMLKEKKARLEAKATQPEIPKVKRYFDEVKRRRDAVDKLMDKNKDNPQSEEDQLGKGGTGR